MSLLMAPYATSKYALEGFFGSLREEFLMKENGVSVTICTLGFIGTDSIVTGIKKYNEGILPKWARLGFSAASSSDTALYIIKGGAQKWKTLSYPKMHTSVLPLHYFMPETMAAFNRYLWT